uniref:Uncharacterized protein n=1 Tax=Salix viminalis TaxID=40686 RepID=A0A6N2MRL5_SALVM
MRITILQIHFAKKDAKKTGEKSAWAFKIFGRQAVPTTQVYSKSITIININVASMNANKFFDVLIAWRYFTAESIRGRGNLRGRLFCFRNRQDWC